jgi:O-antigen/teichoic acid export membrane protein
VPGDYGLMSMAQIGIGLARLVQDVGLDGILVQDRTIVGERLARLAGLILMLGFSLWALFAGLAYPMALFFKEPQVALIVIVMGGVFVTDAVQVIPRAQMQRALRYDQLAWTAFLQLAANQIALVIAVRAGMGVWSLVAGQLAGEIIVSFALIYLSPYQVAWPRQLHTLSGPLVSGWRVLGSRAASYAYGNADQTIIGRLLGKDPLGVYSFATTFSSLPQREIGSIVSQVVPGIFARMQGQPRDLRRYFMRLTEFLTILSFPMSVGMALVADLVMPLALGPQWDSVITPLRLLCAYSVFQSAQAMVSPVLLMTGQFRVHMWCSILAGVVMPPALAAGAHFGGLVGIGWVWALIFPLANLPSFVYAFRTAEMTTRDWLASLVPATTGCLTMSLAVLGARQLFPPGANLGIESGVVIVVGAIVYLATLWFGFRSRIDEAIALGKRIRGRAIEEGLAQVAATS